MAKLTWKVWLLIAVLVLALLAIAPWGYFGKGAVIKSVERNSTIFEEGMRQEMVIRAVNGIPVDNAQDYLDEMQSIFPVDDPVKLIIQTDVQEFIVYAGEAPKIVVADLPSSKIKTGLDLSGGARALIRPEKPLSTAEMNDLLDITQERFNAYGLKDVVIKQQSDLAGNNFMLVEIAEATPAELESLVAQQGKFEAKIGNETVFIGGKQDITYVEEIGQQAGIYDCGQYGDGWLCSFRFPITISANAADDFARITKNLPLNSSTPEYLTKTIDFYIDDKLTESLSIHKNLKGSATTQHSIQGSGSGTTQQDAIKSAQANMKKLQTILKTGSLPYKLEIEKLDSISPVLGREFTKNLIYLAVIVFFIVSVVIFIRYRKIKITGAVVLTMFSEAFITLGIAAFIGWNLDAPGIAGIIAGMGTGVNDQIVILDEAVSNTRETLRERIKRALFVIIGAFFTIIAAMLPLFWAGAGMLKGFALTTIISVSVGILITRPAFADIIRKIQE